MLSARRHVPPLELLLLALIWLCADEEWLLNGGCCYCHDPAKQQHVVVGSCHCGLNNLNNMLCPNKTNKQAAKTNAGKVPARTLSQIWSLQQMNCIYACSTASASCSDASPCYISSCCCYKVTSSSSLCSSCSILHSLLSYSISSCCKVTSSSSSCFCSISPRCCYIVTSSSSLCSSCIYSSLCSSTSSPPAAKWPPLAPPAA